MMSFVFINHIGADGVVYFGVFDILSAGGVWTDPSWAPNNRSLMPPCPLFQPVTPLPCYVLARGALGKNERHGASLVFLFFFPPPYSSPPPRHPTIRHNSRKHVR